MFVVNDLLDAILLGSFFFGLIFSALSLVVGIADLGFGDGHDGDAGGGHDHHVPHPLSVGTILAFLTWFGGFAYLVRNGLGGPAVLSLVVGVLGGLAGGYAIWWSLKRVRASETVLRAEDQRLPGTLARVTSSIREGGVGEVIYEQRGVRYVAAARSTSGAAIPKGEEVVILDRSRGTVVVEPWSALMGDEELYDRALPGS